MKSIFKHSTGFINSFLHKVGLPQNKVKIRKTDKLLTIWEAWELPRTGCLFALLLSIFWLIVTQSIIGTLILIIVFELIPAIVGTYIGYKSLKKIILISDTIVLIHHSKNKDKLTISDLINIEIKEDNLRNKASLIFKTDNLNYVFNGNLTKEEAENCNNAIIDYSKMQIDVKQSKFIDKIKNSTTKISLLYNQNLTEDLINYNDWIIIRKKWKLKAPNIAKPNFDKKLIVEQYVKSKKLEVIAETSGETYVEVEKYYINLDNDDIIEVEKNDFFKIIPTSIAIFEFTKKEHLLFRTKNIKPVQFENESCFDEFIATIDNANYIHYISFILGGTLLRYYVILGYLKIKLIIRKRNALKGINSYKIGVKKFQLIDKYLFTPLSGLPRTVLRSKFKKFYCDPLLTKNVNVGDLIEIKENLSDNMILEVNIIEK